MEWVQDSGRHWEVFSPISLQELFRLDQLASQPPGSQELTMRTNLSSNLRDPWASASQVQGFSGGPTRLCSLVLWGTEWQQMST